MSNNNLTVQSSSTTPSHEWSIAILGGGLATRLESVVHGKSKWLLPIEGRSIRDRQLDVLMPLSSDLLWAGGRHLDPACAHTALRFVADTLPIAGPLAGIHAALQQAKYERVLVVPCDAPTLNPALLLHLLHLANEHPHISAFVPRKPDGYWLPLLAVYTRACVPCIEQLASENIPQVWKLFERLEELAMPPMAVDLASLQVFDTALRSCANINTPADIADFNGEKSSYLPNLHERSKRW